MTTWRIVLDYNRGLLRNVYTICGDCWPRNRNAYTAPLYGWKTDVNEVDPAKLSSDDECHVCSAHPKVERPQ